MKETGKWNQAEPATESAASQAWTGESTGRGIVVDAASSSYRGALLDVRVAGVSRFQVTEAGTVIGDNDGEPVATPYAVGTASASTRRTMLPNSRRVRWLSASNSQYRSAAAGGQRGLVMWNLSTGTAI